MFTLLPVKTELSFGSNKKDMIMDDISCGSPLISEEDYPLTAFLSTGGFCDFTAYDVETTGLSAKTECITEIGAVKVRNGKVTDEKRFAFQQLIRPYAGVTPDKADRVAWLTGITGDMVADAPPVTRIMAEFKEFIGDDILIGYNNKRFDSAFLRRAGMYSGVVITNRQFDVMLFSKPYLNSLGICKQCAKLGELAAALNVRNPRAHRAYADALTTAKIYVCLQTGKTE